MLTPNHCRPADPIVMGFPAREAKTHVFAMASWHLYNQDRFTAFAIQKMGGFSVNREGVDRRAINTAIKSLETAERPLIVFPEGATTRTNDLLNDMLDGVAFIARAAAKKRAQTDPPGQVVVHPVAIKYFFQGNLLDAVKPVLSAIEQRLTWEVSNDKPLLERITQIGTALITLKELEYFGKPQPGNLTDRCQLMIDRLLEPLEDRWLGERKEHGVVPRVKALRMAIVPELAQDAVPIEEKKRRWNDLTDIYLAQQISCYPAHYIASMTTVDRILETLERFEEDLTDKVTVHSPYKVVIQIGNPIPVGTKRDRSAPNDPLMAAIRRELQLLMDQLAAESPLYVDQ